LDISVHLREVVLRSKPAELLTLGGRSSVPQLIDVDGIRYPESLDIIFWALARSEDKKAVNELWPSGSIQRNRMKAWVAYNDHFFKHWLDRYKYADRYPEYSESDYRAKGEVFLHRLDKRLSEREFLFGEKVSLADIAVFPFIRQFAAVDYKWFESSQYSEVKRWLANFVHSEIFNSVVMVKHSAWEAGQENILYPAR
jgi:glutathione S-transferase